MSKVVQHLARISRIRRCAIPTTLLSALVLVPAVVTVSMMFVTPLTQAQTQAPAGYSLEVLHNFDSTDGSAPAAAPIQDAAGNFYGTTQFGGTDGYKTVYKVDVNGAETVLQSFTGSNGLLPPGPLLQDASGNLYGTALAGGHLSACGGIGCGVVFKIDVKGTFTVLHAFSSVARGILLAPGLFRDSAGNLYGTTQLGGREMRAARVSSVAAVRPCVHGGCLNHAHGHKTCCQPMEDFPVHPLLVS